jgi:hypothetical protein
MRKPIDDLTQTPEYVASMRPIVERYRPLLKQMGYDLDKDWNLCEFMVWHMMPDDDKNEVITETLLQVA